MDFQISPEQRDLQHLVRAIAQEKLKPLAPRWDRTNRRLATWKIAY